ncbi:MAG: alanine racemase [Candidatus Omnitrophica bacterium]|nr:alanine racemase [Candidatus Omnitrophota bacterium]
MSKAKYIGYRPTWAEVDLSNLAYNFREIKKILSPETKVMACVKADAYGHGLVPVAKKLVSCGVDFLGVASIDEAIRLRKEKIKVPILVLGAVLKKDIEPLFEYGIQPTICEEALAAAINNKARRLGKKINVHIKVDTGMGRIGILHHSADRFLEKVSGFKNLNIEGIFTHFPVADKNRDFTLRQIKAFASLIENAKKSGINIPLAHAANSVGIVDYKESHFDMVRPGLVIYGLYPKENLKLKLKPVLSLKTKIVFVKDLPAGYGVSYGHDYVTKKKTKIATLPIGYGDGYPRNLSNLASVLIKGRRLKISGRICMDQIMVDVGGLAVRPGDEVVFIGSQGEQKITTEELARFSGTIPYEIVCGLGSRIPRVYTE